MCLIEEKIMTNKENLRKPAALEMKAMLRSVLEDLEAGRLSDGTEDPTSRHTMQAIKSILAKSKNKKTGKKRFIDNGDGTATDKVTGLTWLIDDAVFCGENGLPWEEAIKKAAKWKYAGHKDWRVPGYHELVSLVTFDGKDGLMDKVFEGHRTGYSWTSQDYVPNTANAMIVGFTNGSVTDASKTGAYYVRPVRGDPKIT